MGQQPQRSSQANDVGRRDFDDDSRSTRQRRRLVERQLMTRGISDARVLDAMYHVPRDRFVSRAKRGAAYQDRPLSIGLGQTISQPYMVALMAQTAVIGPDDRVLEIGTGSGYGAAVLADLASWVWTVERHRQLAVAAADRLARLGFDNVTVVCGDGTLGWRKEAPYDAIVVTAAGSEVPAMLREQLVDGGRLVIPVGDLSGEQRLLKVIRRGGVFHTTDICGVRFVPLIGVHGLLSE